MPSNMEPIRVSDNACGRDNTALNVILKITSIFNSIYSMETLSPKSSKLMKTWIEISQYVDSLVSLITITILKKLTVSISNLG